MPRYGAHACRRLRYKDTGGVCRDIPSFRRGDRLFLFKRYALNDSKKDLGSRVDRHESIGKGLMGLDTFRMIMADPRFDNMPLILETPDEALWPEEIQLLYKQLKS